MNNLNIFLMGIPFIIILITCVIYMCTGQEMSNIQIVAVIALGFLYIGELIKRN